MDAIDYIRAFLRRWPIIAVAALIGAVFAFVGTDPEPEPIERTYEATHTLLVNDQQQYEFGGQSLIGTITFAQVPVFATTGDVPRTVAEQLDWTGSPAALAAQVTVTGDPQTGTLTFSTSQDSPSDAVALADAFADATVAYIAQAQDELVQRRLARTLAQVQDLEAEVRELDAQVAAEIAEQAEAATAAAAAAEAAGRPAPVQPTLEVDSVLRAQRDTAAREYGIALEGYRALVAQEIQPLNLTTLERAQPIEVSTGGFAAPRTRSTRVPIAAGIGAVLGAGVALLAERFDARLRDRRRAEEAFGAPVVAELPTMSRKQRAARLVVRPEEHSAVAEAFRSLRTSVTFMAAGGQPLADDDRVGIVLITSPSPAEGKTTVAANLAAAFAETGRSVVVANADFRRPTVSTILAPGERPPLPAGLAGIDRLGAEAYLIPTQHPGVQLLDLSPLGGTPGDLTRATVKLAATLNQLVDVVIIDTPPLVVTTEALEFVPDAKVVVLVGRLGRTAINGAERAGELARFGGAEQIAVALSDTGSSHLRRASYYDYYGGRRRRRSRNAWVQDSDALTGRVETNGDEPGDEWAEVDELIERKT